MVEALSSMLVKAKDIGHIEGFEMGCSREVITHLQFADDTMSFSSSRTQEVADLKRILRSVQLVSSLNISMSKYMVVGVGVLRGYCLVFGCQFLL